MSLRVVLADDHVVLRQGVRALLERHGFEVVAEASDGRTAVELTRQHEPNVAVLDIMMPSTATFGSCCRVSSTAVLPSEASATTSKPCRSSRARTPCRSTT